MTPEQTLKAVAKEHAAEEWTPYPAQILAMTTPAREIFYGGARGGGKALSVESSVLTPFGFARNGDLRVGSLVSNPDGTAATVIGVYPQGVQDLFRVTTVDGGSVLATGDHLWNARKTCRKMKADRRYQHNGEPVTWKVMTTWQMVEHLRTQRDLKQLSNLLIPLTLPVEFTRPSATRWGEAVTIDPYVLGVLIGDGCFRGAELSFTSIDDEIVREVATRTGLSLRQNGITFAILGSRDVVSELKRYQLWGHLAPDKFVPDAYRHAPIYARRLILQGLMDTDGTADSEGGCSFCSTSPRLAEDVQWIARSLGYKATIANKQGRYRDAAGDVVECRIAYNVYIQGPQTAELFKLTRKRTRCREEFNGGVSEPARRIVSIEPEGRGEAQCISVDHPNSLYITADFIVTHNSWIQRLWLARMAVEESKPGTLKYPTYKGAIFRYHSVDLRDWHKEAELLYCAKLGAKPAGNPREYRFPGGPVIRSGHLQEGGYIHYVGWEIHKMAIDEATHLPTITNRDTGVPESPDYQLLNNGSVRLSPDGIPQSLLTGNPGFKGDRWIKERFVKVKIDGELVPPRTLFKDPVSGNTRIFVNATVFENPWIVQNDPGYIRSLMELSPTKQKAWIYGDWDAYEGQFFDFDPVRHVIEPEQAAPAIPPHVYRWLSCDWGYAHPCAVHAGAQGLDGRIHVYKELGFESKTGSFEVGVEIAKAFLSDIESLPDNSLTLYLSHDAFHREDSGDRRVDTIRAGIMTVLGPQSCFILEMNEDEKSEAMKDPDIAVRRMNVRRSQSTRGYGITICRADKNSVAGWDYMRELLRTEQVVIQGEPDAAIVQRLRGNPNGEALVSNYLQGFNQRAEVLPKILIHSCCKRLIETIGEMQYDTKDPEKMLKTDGDDYVDSLAYLCAAHRAQQNMMPLPYYVSTQIQEAFHGRTVDISMAHLMNLKAKENYDKQFNSGGSMRLGRFAGRGSLGVQ